MSWNMPMEERTQPKKLLLVANVVKEHVLKFHVPTIRALKAQGWTVDVAASGEEDVPNCDHQIRGVWKRSPFTLDTLRGVRQLKRLLDEENYDIVYCHTPVGSLVARLAALGARKRGTKVVYFAHGFHFFTGAPLVNWLVYFPVEWLLSALTDVLITINREDFDRAQRRLRAKKTVYIPGVGIDTARFRGNEEKGAALRRELGIPENAEVLLSVGDLNKNKNHRAVLEALAGMEERNQYYVVCGRGLLKESLEAFTRKKGLAGRVWFMGYRSDVADFYAMADVFVFPSFREGLSVSVMEAMASGKPIICSRIRGNTDMVEDGVNGFLIDPASPESISRALGLLEDCDKRTKFSENNREKAEEFSLEHISEQYRRVYLETSGGME